MFQRLVVASIAAVALSVGAAALASSADAETFQAEKYPATINGEATNKFTISNGTRSISCANATLTGKLAAASEELQVTPNVAETSCTAEGIYIRLTMEETPHWDWKFLRWTFLIPDYFIKWTAGRWKWDIWLTQKAFEEEKPTVCTFEASEAGNTAVETLTGINEGSGAERHMIMELNVNNLLIKRVSGTEANCGKEKQPAGTITGKFNVTASNEGKSDGFWFG